MNAALQEFIKNDGGFEQYVERYEDISTDLAVRWLIAAWTAEMDKPDIWKAIGKAEGKAEAIAECKAKGIAEGKAEGIAEGKQEKAVEAAIRMLKKGVSPEVVADYLDLPLFQVNKLA